jgi:hypothetical protein
MGQKAGSAGLAYIDLHCNLSLLQQAIVQQRRAFFEWVFLLFGRHALKFVLFSNSQHGPLTGSAVPFTVKRPNREVQQYDHKCLFFLAER